MLEYTSLGQFDGLQTGRSQIFIDDAAHPILHHINGPGDRKCCYGKPARHSFDHHHAKRIGEAWKDKAVSTGICPREVISVAVASKDGIRVFAFQFFSMRTIADQHLGARKVEL